MKIQFITTAFNGMAQRLWIELDRLNYQVHVVIPISSEQLINETEKYKPKLIIAPFLTSKIPKEIYENYTCLIVHPGIKGDRGASSLDWAILRQEKTWGVTILEAVEKMDAGPVWAYNEFIMRSVSKGEIYRNEVTQAASKGIIQALDNFKNITFKPEPLDYSNSEIIGKWNNKTTQKDFTFSWEDDTNEIIHKINAADSSPGVLITLFDNDYYCYGAHLETRLKGRYGSIVAQRNNAICIATKNNAIWITHLKSLNEGQVKLPAILALGELANEIPISNRSPFENFEGETWQEIRFEQDGEIGYLYFDFYNGAMSSDQCNRLRDAIIETKKRAKLIVLMGGKDVWSNGIHLNVIENSNNPAKESWENINAIDDLILEIINSTEHYIVSVLQGNAGAGGVSLALAADKVLCRNGIVLNPHTKNMGLYGSEYWTYLLPKRIGFKKAERFTEDCLPWGVDVALEIGLIDGFYGETNTEFVNNVKQQAQEIINLPYFDKLIKAKHFQRKKDERNKPLVNYRKEELEKMHKNFFDNNMDYNYKRYCFVHKISDSTSETVKNLYRNRREIYRKRKWENINYIEEE
ncbi:MAG TPA: hydrogenase maturation protein [Flavobacteriaceae bacterium]|jgi:putative two-component system hydrogenase maturation factor HypX/HoxX|nr:hydrogenase maturation protein [Flavobacteriaceae bacterium]HBS13192.1 hydrogenase maturation protein [Flavobacteriaceae bacterium]